MKTLPAINVQFPISQLILSGQKTVETRTYPIPRQWISQPMWIIETPGKTGTFKARAIGVVTFGNSFRYKDKKTFYETSDDIGSCRILRGPGPTRVNGDGPSS